MPPPTSHNSETVVVPVNEISAAAPSDTTVRASAPLTSHHQAVCNGVQNAISTTADIVAAIPAAAAAPLTAAALVYSFAQQAGIVQKRSTCNMCQAEDYVFSDQYTRDAQKRLPMCKNCWEYSVHSPDCPEHERRTRSAGVYAGVLHGNEKRAYWDVCIACDQWFMNHPWLGDEDGHCKSCINDELGF